jgi:hypothetical protein
VTAVARLRSSLSFVLLRRQVDDLPHHGVSDILLKLANLAGNRVNRLQRLGVGGYEGLDMTDKRGYACSERPVRRYVAQVRPHPQCEAYSREDGRADCRSSCPSWFVGGAVP